MLRNKCRSFPEKTFFSANEKEYADKIAAALKIELKLNQKSMKELQNWTSASKRGIENWLNGNNLPSGAHLIMLMKHSDEVMKTCLALANRPQLTVAIGLIEQLDLMESFAAHHKSLLLAMGVNKAFDRYPIKTTIR